jgi:hypothetical protein
LIKSKMKFMKYVSAQTLCLETKREGKHNKKLYKETISNFVLEKAINYISSNLRPILLFFNQTPPEYLIHPFCFWPTCTKVRTILIQKYRLFCQIWRCFVWLLIFYFDIFFKHHCF